jgi:hypothetical protein
LPFQSGSFEEKKLFSKKVPSVLFELKIPREVMKSPKAMEQVLLTIHSLRNSPATLRDIYWDGETPRSFSLEIVSFEGQIHLYVRTPETWKGLIEASLFSYYPDIEVEEVADYIDKFPENMSDADSRSLTLGGSELILAKEAAYPIKTYVDFESPEEERQYDPMSALLEVLAKMRNREIGAVQMVIVPKDPKWHDEWLSLLIGLREKKTNKPAGKVKSKIEFPGGGPLPVFVTEDQKSDPASQFLIRSPGETKILEAVENNLSKPAFDVTLRFIYIGPKENKAMLSSFGYGITAAFNQYKSQHLIVLTLAEGGSMFGRQA